MSFILDSIKQAERERKLGKVVPSISIEYTTGDAVIENPVWRQRGLLLLGLVLTAFAVWAATTYLIKTKGVDEQANVIRDDVKVVSNILDQESSPSIKKDIAIVPIKKIHQSNLKTIEVITEENATHETKIKSANVDSVTPIGSNSVAKIDSVKKSKPSYELKPVIVKKSNQNEMKQEIAAIYSDLSNKVLKKENENSKRIIEIKPANYVVEENTLPKSTVTQTTQKAAISTGLPSFGELPYEIQEQIPQFNVSVHMFHSDPNQRRIRINGSMYLEGKTVQQDFALIEITRYGAIFDYRGHLFRYNVR